MGDKPGPNNVTLEPFLLRKWERKKRKRWRQVGKVSGGDKSKTSQEDCKSWRNWIPLLSKWQWGKTETCGIEMRDNQGTHGKQAVSATANRIGTGDQLLRDTGPGSCMQLYVHMFSSYLYVIYRYSTPPNWSNWHPKRLRGDIKRVITANQLPRAQSIRSLPAGWVGPGPPSLWQQPLHWSEHQRQDEEEAHHLQNWLFDLIRSFIVGFIRHVDIMILLILAPSSWFRNMQADQAVLRYTQSCFTNAGKSTKFGFCAGVSLLGELFAYHIGSRP